MSDDRYPRLTVAVLLAVLVVVAMCATLGAR